jgi:hypothetical protein
MTDLPGQHPTGGSDEHVPVQFLIMENWKLEENREGI